jgi:hypothetical protein
MKLDLLTNSTVVDDAIGFVSDRSKDKENLTHLQVIAMKMTQRNQTSQIMMKLMKIG